MTESVAPSAKRAGGYQPLAGRLPSSIASSRALVVARLRAQRDLRFALARLGKFLRNPETPVDEFYLRAIGQLADRVGMPRATSQVVDTVSASVTVERREVQVTGGVTSDDALEFVERRVMALKAARAAALVVPEASPNE